MQGLLFVDWKQPFQCWLIRKNHQVAFASNLMPEGYDQYFHPAVVLAFVI